MIADRVGRDPKLYGDERLDKLVSDDIRAETVKYGAALAVVLGVASLLFFTR